MPSDSSLPDWLWNQRTAMCSRSECAVRRHDGIPNLLYSKFDRVNGVDRGQRAATGRGRVARLRCVGHASLRDVLRAHSASPRMRGHTPAATTCAGASDMPHVEVGPDANSFRKQSSVTPDGLGEASQRRRELGLRARTPFVRASIWAGSHRTRTGRPPGRLLSAAGKARPGGGILEWHRPCTHRRWSEETGCPGGETCRGCLAERTERGILLDRARRPT